MDESAPANVYSDMADAASVDVEEKKIAGPNLLSRELFTIIILGARRVGQLDVMLAVDI